MPPHPFACWCGRVKKNNWNFKTRFPIFLYFSVHLPLSNSLEMFHDDVGMKSATTDEFAPGREKEKKNAVGILILYREECKRHLQNCCRSSKIIWGTAVIKMRSMLCVGRLTHMGSRTSKVEKGTGPSWSLFCRAVTGRPCVNQATNLRDVFGPP